MLYKIICSDVILDSKNFMRKRKILVNVTSCCSHFDKHTEKGDSYKIKWIIIATEFIIILFQECTDYKEKHK